MHSVRIEVAKLNLVGTRITHHATGDAGIGENNVEPTAKRSSLCFYDTTMYNALWYYGTVLLWYFGTMVVEQCALSYYGITVLWYSATMVIWYYGIMIQ